MGRDSDRRWLRPESCRARCCFFFDSGRALSAPLPPRSGGEGSGVGGAEITERSPPTPDPSPPFAARMGGGAPQHPAHLTLNHRESSTPIVEFTAASLILTHHHRAAWPRIWSRAARTALMMFW
ncbi:MAG: hypothetical protein GEU95_03255 [Rhizobiales bacterium]|nr:hypothetical protein [Hyphomicrobiales bacterium]